MSKQGAFKTRAAVQEGAIYQGKKTNKEGKKTDDIYKKNRNECGGKPFRSNNVDIKILEPRQNSAIIGFKVTLPKDYKGEVRAGDVFGVHPKNTRAVVERLQKIYQHIPENAEFKFKKGKEGPKSFPKYDSKYNKQETLEHIETNTVNYSLIEFIIHAIESKNIANKFYYGNLEKLYYLQKLHELDPNKCKAILDNTNVVDVLAAFPKVVELGDLVRIQDIAHRRVYTISGVDIDQKTLKPNAVDICVATQSHYVVPHTSFGGG